MVEIKIDKEERDMHATLFISVESGCLSSVHALCSSIPHYEVH